jgi:hypothetical protein
MADIRVASTRARFGELFVKRGLCCDVAGIGRLAQLVGREHAAELLFTGRIVDATEAHELRLVSRVVEHEQLLPIAHALAAEIAANPLLAVRQLKAGLRRARSRLGRPGPLGRHASGDSSRPRDHREGVAASSRARASIRQAVTSACAEPDAHPPSPDASTRHDSERTRRESDAPAGRSDASARFDASRTSPAHPPGPASGAADAAQSAGAPGPRRRSRETSRFLSDLPSMDKTAAERPHGGADRAAPRPMRARAAESSRSSAKLANVGAAVDPAGTRAASTCGSRRDASARRSALRPLARRRRRPSLSRGPEGHARSDRSANST